MSSRKYNENSAWPAAVTLLSLAIDHSSRNRWLCQTMKTTFAFTFMHDVQIFFGNTLTEYLPAKNSYHKLNAIYLSVTESVLSKKNTANFTPAKKVSFLYVHNIFQRRELMLHGGNILLVTLSIYEWRLKNVKIMQTDIFLELLRIADHCLTNK